MLEISKKLFAAFNESEVIYCSWKGNDHLDKCLSGIGDIDILVSKDSKSKCYQTLKELEFLHCESQFGYRIPNVEDWIGFDKETGNMIHVHLHFKIVAGKFGIMEYDLPWASMALETRLLHKDVNVFIIEPELELITRYALLTLSPNRLTEIKHKVKGYNIPKKYKTEIEYLKTNIENGKLQDYINKLFPNKSSRVFELITKVDLTSHDFFELRFIYKKTFRFNQRYNVLSLKVRELKMIVAPIIRKTIRKIYPTKILIRKTPISGKAPIITFMGQDGAGKSTVVKDIREWLSWKLEVSQFYLGSGDHYQPWEKRLQNRLHGSNNPFAKLICKWLPFSYLSKLGKNVYKTIVKANKYANKGGIVLFDRYPQIQYEGINDGPKIRTSIMHHAKNEILYAIADFYAKREEKYLQKAVAYPPDVVIKLMLTPEESIRRKPHENYEAVKHKHEIIKSLKFDSAAVYTVDATQDYEKEILEIKKIIWQHILKS